MSDYNVLQTIGLALRDFLWEAFAVDSQINPQFINSVFAQFSIEELTRI